MYGKTAHASAARDVVPAEQAVEEGLLLLAAPAVFRWYGGRTT